MDRELGTAVAATIADWIGPVVSATVVFRTGEAARFSRFPGSAWRGAFGHSLKRLVCVMHLRPCEGCPLRNTCVFPQIFEPPVPAAAPILTNYRSAPTAFVLDPEETPAPGRYAEGEAIAVTLRMFGRMSGLAPYAVRALVDAAARGIGPDRARLAPILLKAGLGSDLSPARPFDPDAASAVLAPLGLAVPRRPAAPVLLRFATPLRLRVKNDLVTPAGFRPSHLLGAAVRRASLLALFFGNGAPNLDFRALQAAARNLEWAESSFHWVETTRRSARQQAIMQMGGILGYAVLDLGGAPELWPFLWLGQWLHVGKSSTMGFGRYRIAPT
ncbi:MAG: CRISPR system precrRNA processing endoribonuclease RAMP protein Cas6 [Acetobacteraceae bacterium]